MTDEEEATIELDGIIYYLRRGQWYFKSHENGFVVTNGHMSGALHKIHALEDRIRTADDILDAEWSGETGRPMQAIRLARQALRGYKEPIGPQSEVVGPPDGVVF